MYAYSFLSQSSTGRLLISLVLLWRWCPVVMWGWLPVARSGPWTHCAWFPPPMSRSHSLLRVSACIIHIPSRVNNKKGKRVSNARIICVWQVAWLPALRTWVIPGANRSIFSGLWRTKAFFVSFMLDSSWISFYIVICWRFRSKSRPC
jgi:hypothetical protein